MMRSALSRWLAADRDLRRVIAWVAGVAMVAVAGPASGVFRVLGDRPIDIDPTLTLVSVYLASIGMTLPTGLLLFITGKGTAHYTSAVIFVFTAFISVGVVATLQTDFTSQVSQGGSNSSPQALTFADTAALIAIAIAAIVFVFTLIMQMELARTKYEQ